MKDIDNSAYFNYLASDTAHEPVHPSKPISLEKLWADKAQLLSGFPEQDQMYIKLGILEEYICNGIEKGASFDKLFLVAAYGLALANNDLPFYDRISKAVTSSPTVPSASS